MRRYLLPLALLAGITAMAQDRVEPYARVDLTSTYLWRGYKVAGVSIQPEAGLRWKGASLYVWGNEEVAPAAGANAPHEIDLFLKYKFCDQLTVGLMNVYVSNRGDGFLSYGSIPHAANGLDATLSCNLKYATVDWSTTIAGYDGYNHDGKRAYGSYLQLGVPFRVSAFDCQAKVGIVPYYNTVYDLDRASGFHVNMCSLKASHTFKLLNDKADITPYTQLMVNPSSRNAFFQVGVSLGYDPK